MDGCTALKFVKHVKIVFCPSWRFVCDMRIRAELCVQQEGCMDMIDEIWKAVLIKVSLAFFFSFSFSYFVVIHNAACMHFLVYQSSEANVGKYPSTYTNCTNSKLRRRQFWHFLQTWLLSSHPWHNMNAQCTMWKKVNMLSSNDSNLMIFHFNFERFRIESRLNFPFLTHTVYSIFRHIYIWRDECNVFYLKYLCAVCSFVTLIGLMIMMTMMIRLWCTHPL